MAHRCVVTHDLFRNQIVIPNSKKGMYIASKEMVKNSKINTFYVQAVCKAIYKIPRQYKAVKYFERTIKHTLNVHH